MIGKNEQLHLVTSKQAYFEEQDAVIMQSITSFFDGCDRQSQIGVISVLKQGGCLNVVRPSLDLCTERALSTTLFSQETPMLFVIGRAGASPPCRTTGTIFYIYRSCPIPHISKCFYVFLFMHERTVEYREPQIETRVRFDCQQHYGREARF